VEPPQRPDSPFYRPRDLEDSRLFSAKVPVGKIFANGPNQLTTVVHTPKRRSVSTSDGIVVDARSTKLMRDASASGGRDLEGAQDGRPSLLFPPRIKQGISNGPGFPSVSIDDFRQVQVIQNVCKGRGVRGGGRVGGGGLVGGEGGSRGMEPSCMLTV